MRVAFYSTMKPPDHPIPSGDRVIAQNLFKALEALGHEVFIPSREPSWRREPDPEVLDTMRQTMEAEFKHLQRLFNHKESIPDLWITYHNYHKAPDLLGPKLSKEFDIPYMIIEASRAGKRKFDDWANGLAAADFALTQADLVVSFTTPDEKGISSIVPTEKRMRIPPFIENTKFSERAISNTVEPPVRLLTVAMMRPGDKFESYQILAKSLGLVKDLSWHLTIVGDGPMRNDVESLFDGMNCTMAGRIDGDKLKKYYQKSDVFLWPAVNEAFGMTLLEAQAASLAIVAGKSNGVPEIVKDGKCGVLVDPHDVEAFANAVRRILTDDELRQRLSFGAFENAKSVHGFDRGVTNLKLAIKQTLSNHRSQNDSNRTGGS